ncbi:catalase family peroxidase [Peribacillus sp. B-H-3]|uniref:catalase family peroxidase n=1 Tax=Peribacillus sp. B-H-3 TaxID=3400420 RepID=UPI003B02D5B7
MKSNDHSDLAVQAVDDIEHISGTFPGYRRAHARGRCYKGIFTPNGKAAPLTTAAHLQTEPVPVIVRFSNSSPNPGHSDALTPVKGMSVQFQLGNGEITNLIAVTIPVFFAKSPEAFAEMFKLIKSAKTGLPNLKSLMKVLVKYPEGEAALRILKEMHPPASYGTAQYYSIHAFYFVSKEGRRQAVKYQWRPDAGLGMLKLKEAANRSEDYLDQEMDERLKQAPVGLNLDVQLGAEEDPTDDPTVIWPEDRQKITVGHLEITERLEDQGEDLLFDPTVITDGIQLSEDKILHFRHAAYKESYHRRIHNE